MFVRTNNEISPLEKKVIDFVKKENGRPILPMIIANKLKRGSIKPILSAIDYLVEQEILIKLNNGKLVLGYENGPLLDDAIYEGTITLSAKGDGFFKKNDDTKSSIYINKKNIKDALDGDKVQVCLMDKIPTYDDLQDGVVLKVIERSRDFFVGTYYKKTDNGKKEVEIVPQDIKIKLKIVLDDDSNLVNGSKVLFQIANIKNGTIYCSVSKILGHIDDVGTDIISIVYDNGIQPEFEEKVNNEVDKISFNFSPEEDSKRKDLSKLNFVTIDPATSKDMDDAIYVEKFGDDYKLYVAIADVSYYVKINTELWKSTIKRGTSIYLVNQVIPMLPHKLSNEICSLNPFEKRYAMICEMVIDKNGLFKNIDVYAGIIESKKKFAYDDINQYFKTGFKLENVDDDLYKMIDVARQLHQFLDIRHKKEGYIDFEINEPQIILDENQKIKDILVKKTGEAQKMIENFMVAANEAVTIKFEQLKPNLPFVYRVHGKPEEKRIEAFKIEAKKIGFKFDDQLKEWKPDTVSKWLKNNKENPNKELINMILLRTMAKAKYDSINVGHFGLSLKKYTHFTSPIRRLADVIVHYLFRAFILDYKNYTDHERNYILENLDLFNQNANTTEINAVSTERDVNAMKFAEFMETKIGFEYEGFVSFVTSFGLFVQLENTIEGLVKPINIGDDFYIYDEDSLTYVGKNKKRIISLGQKVKIRVIGASKEMKKIDFEIIDYL